MMLSLFLFFTSAHAEVFTPAFVDSKGFEWSRKLEGRYSNGCITSDGRMHWQACSPRIESAQDSSAFAICQELGASLPTEEEFKDLLRNFENESDDYSVGLTPKGFADIQRVFQGDMEGKLWTSTVDDYRYDYNRIYYGSSKKDQIIATTTTDNRLVKYGVVCVRRKQ